MSVRLYVFYRDVLGLRTRGDRRRFAVSVVAFGAFSILLGAALYAGGLA